MVMTIVVTSVPDVSIVVTPVPDVSIVVTPQETVTVSAMPAVVVVGGVVSAVSAGEFLVRFSYGDSTPKLLNLPVTGLVDRILLGIETPFNAPSTLSIGTTANPSLLMAVDQNLPTEVGQFESSPSANLVNQQIILTITPGLGISQGSGFVIVEYSVP